MPAKLLVHLRNQWMGALALFLVLTGGVAYAANTIFSTDIVNNEVYGADVRDDTLTGGGLGHVDLKAGSVRSSEVAADSLTGADIANVAGGSDNVNADKLDGQDATAFQKTGCQPTVPGTGAMVQVGPTCIDKYEASVWSSPTGGTQYGVNADDYPCNNNGQDCSNIYARSVRGVVPSTQITWLQAAAALANSGKRLPLNVEWQQAVQGTPDPGLSPGPEDCNTNSSGPEPTGERADCVSSYGVNDMVGNLNEWVADWMSFPSNCRSWSSFSDDQMCLSGASTTADAPGALSRGGAYNFGAAAGPFAVSGRAPNDTLLYGGFRGAR